MTDQFVKRGVDLIQELADRLRAEGRSKDADAVENVLEMFKNEF